MKTLKTDTSDKLDTLLDPLLKTDAAPVFYGSWPLEKVLKHFPNAEELRREIYGKMTTSIEDLFKKANRQIRMTKSTFSLPDSEGALVLANDSLAIHTPEILGHRISQLLTKRAGDGSLRYPHIDAVWVVTETHLAKVSDGLHGLPALLVKRDVEGRAFKLLDSYQREWATFNGLPFLEMDARLLSLVDFKENSQETHGSESRISRTEFLRRRYNSRPYLRNLTEDELGSYFRQLMMYLSHASLKGARQDEKESLIPMIDRFADFLEEVAHRGVDIKAYSHLVKDLLEHRPDPSPVNAKLAHLDSLCSKPTVLEPGRFYTDARGSVYRCLRIDGDAAVLLLMTIYIGKTLDAVVRSGSTKWHLFTRLRDSQKVKAYEQRFARFVEANPRFAERAQ